MSKEPIKILLIDDEVQFVDTLKDRLFLRGFDAAVAYNGEDGLKKVKANPPDVIVLDLRMPGIDGFEVLRAVKKTNPEVQVIILAYRDRIEKPYVAAAMADGGDFDSAREVMREKDLMKDRK